MHRKALFLDRDGTLIVDVGYPREPERVAIIPGAVAALRELSSTYDLVVISNQSGIARGLITPEEAAAVHARFVALFAAEGILFAGAYYCPHGPDEGCACRKPEPGLLIEAAGELGLELSSSVMVGDKDSDLEAGRAAGCPHTLRYAGDWPAISRALALVR